MFRKTMIPSLIAVVPALILSGCFEAKTTVTVEKDGSGTVEQAIYYPEMDAGALGMSFDVEGEAAGGFDFGDSNDQPTEEEQLAATRAEAEKMAAEMGEGVSLQAVEALPPRNGRKGVRIVYAFRDINKLRLDPLPEITVGDGMQIGGGGGPMGDFPAEDQFGEDPAPAHDEEGDKIRFEFQAAPLPTLTIYTPDMTPPSGGAPQAPDDNNDPQAQAMARMMMQQMLSGMLLEFRVRLNGSLTETNATYASRQSNAIGLYRMDFDKLVKDQAALEKLISMDTTADADAVEKQLEDPQLGRYLKLEMQDRVDVSFE